MKERVYTGNQKINKRHQDTKSLRYTKKGSFFFNIRDSLCLCAFVAKLYCVGSKNTTPAVN